MPQPLRKSAIANLQSKIVLDRAWLRRRLLGWFARHARVLPWRSSRDPYAIWVSEIMLQQTQVASVIPYFKRFMTVLPTLGALAQADIHDVLRLWEGLGYYRRARDLHRAAQILFAEHRGIFPDDAEVLHSLPGFGRYTVGAVLSQAFDRRLPILETNSVRVLCRLSGANQDPKKEPLRGRLWQLAAELLPHKHIGQFNQALMELGALICTITNPKCSACPLAKCCAAHRHGLQAEIPLRTKKAKPVAVREVAAVVRRGKRVLLAQRPAEGRWGGLWEFPRTTLDDQEDAKRAATRLLAEIGIAAEVGAERMVIRHSVTRFRIELRCLDARWLGGRCKVGLYQRFQWLKAEELTQFPVSSPQRRLARVVESVGTPDRPSRARSVLAE